jgi:hypothetical protein
MSVASGPNIVTSGLTMMVDAASPGSYSGTGTVWRDTVQGLRLNSYGTQTTWGTVGGTRAFTFNGSGYWQMDAGFNNVPLGGDCTIILWLYEVGHSVRKTVFEKAGTIYASYQQEVAMTWEVGQDISWYSRQSPDYDYASTAAGDTNKWNMMAIKMSTGLTSAARTGFNSKNGAPWQSSYYSRSNVALVPAGPVIIGSGYAGPVDNGSVSLVACYNRMLSDAEIAQNYEAWRTRFSL